MKTIPAIRAKYARAAQTINSRMARKHTDFNDAGGKIAGIVYEPPKPEIDRTLFGDLSEMYEYKRPWQRRVR
jgi:hypothetical protein